MHTHGRLPVDHSKTLRQRLAEGKTIHEALAELRAAGASISDCIVSVRSVYSFDLSEAKRLVHSSTAWADVVAATEADFRGLAGDEDAEA